MREDKRFLPLSWTCQPWPMFGLVCELKSGSILQRLPAECCRHAGQRGAEEDMAHNHYSLLIQRRTYPCTLNEFVNNGCSLNHGNFSQDV